MTDKGNRRGKEAARFLKRKEISVILRCIECRREYPIDEVRYRCECGDLLEVVHDIEALRKKVSSQLFDERLTRGKFPYNSGVWRYKELVSNIDSKFIISRPEGNTNLYQAGKVAEYVGISNIWLKHEGENPTGSFKDRGMTCAISWQKCLVLRR